MGSSNLIAGAILILAGVLLTITGIGSIIGIPLACLGGAVMFPNLAKFLIGLGIAGAIIFYINAPV